MEMCVGTDKEVHADLVTYFMENSRLKYSHFSGIKGPIHDPQPHICGKKG